MFLKFKLFFLLVVTYQIVFPDGYAARGGSLLLVLFMVSGF
jgi:hypothetical protein